MSRLLRHAGGNGDLILCPSHRTAFEEEVIFKTVENFLSNFVFLEYLNCFNIMGTRIILCQLYNNGLLSITA